jgi:hemoglobin/transferrin/lactoferrin receptor protein
MTRHRGTTQCATAIAAVLALGAANLPAQAQEIALDGIVITNSKIEEKAIDAYSGSSSVGGSTLEDQYPSEDLPAVLNSIPGLGTQITARDPGVAINIRGLQDFGRVNVLIEGARQNFQRSGHAANGVFYLEPEMIKRIDVTRGPSATIYGSGAIGGVVAFGLLDADDILRNGENQAVRMRGRYGSNGNARFGSATGAVRSGGFDIVAQGNLRKDDNYKDGDGNTVDASGQDTDSYMAKARWKFAGGHKLAASAIKYHSNFIDSATGTSTTRRDSELDNEQFTLGYDYSNANTPLFDFKSKIYRNTTSLDQVRLDNGSVSEPAGSRRSFDIITDGFDISNTSRFKVGDVKVALTVGGDAFRDKVRTSDPAGNGDEFTPGGTREVWGGFAQSKLTFFDTIDLITAIRYDSYKLSGGGTLASGERASPKATLGWKVFHGVSIFGTYSEGYRAPAVTETLIAGIHPGGFAFTLLPNPNLRPEVARNIEAGLNLSFDGIQKPTDKFRMKVVAYRNKIRDFIDGVYSPFPPPFGQYQYQNIANATINGVEAEVSYDANTWFVAATASRACGDDDDTGDALRTVGPDNVTATIGVRRLDGRLIAGVRGNFYASQKRVTDATLHVDGYTTVDLFGRYIINDHATVNLNIDNVLDKDYRVYLNQSDSPGLSARLGLTVRLGG